ncbi:MAG: class I SAM-dependent methyltransferase [Bacteroidota bacterium]
MEDFVKVYDNSEQVNCYINEKDLQKPEQAIINKYFDKIKNSVLLDVGIGTGRTTYHLSGIAKKYVGVDISQGMLNGANENFRNQNLDFKVCDARNMSIFEDNTFDVVFFSFNGIDYIEIDERILFFDEVKRISKKDALLIFSTHNIQNIPRLMRLKFSNHPKVFYEYCIKYLKLKFHNWSADLSNNKVIKINDGLHNFKFLTTYINPIYQKELLENYGFKNVCCFGYPSGNELNSDELINTTDPWIYFSCTVNN